MGCNFTTKPPAFLGRSHGRRGGGPRRGASARADALVADPDGYQKIAENLRDFGTFGHGAVPTAYRPPLYPLLLLPCVTLQSWAPVAIGLVHLALGVGTVWLTCRVGDLWVRKTLPTTTGLTRRSLDWRPCLAALLVAVDPILLRQSCLVMTETLATFLAVAALATLAITANRRSPGLHLLAGAASGLAALCRPTFLPWTAVVGVFLWVRWPSDRSRAATSLACFLGGAALVLLPWVVRNTIVFGRPIATTTHGGFTLLLANNPSFYEYLRSSPSDLPWNGDEVNRWWGDTPQGTAQSELGADRLAYRRAWGFIGQEPGMFALSCCARVGRLWSLVPYRIPPHEGVTAEERPTSRLLRYGIGCWYLLELGLAVLGLVVVFPRTHHSNCVPGILLAACFTAVHALYWTDMRMRSPHAGGGALRLDRTGLGVRSDWSRASEIRKRR